MVSRLKAERIRRLADEAARVAAAATALAFLGDRPRPSSGRARRSGALGRLGPAPDCRSPQDSEACGAMYAAMVTGSGPHRREQAIVAAREAAGLPAEETRAEAKERLIRHLSSIVGGSGVSVGADVGGDGVLALEELEEKPAYDAWVDQVEEAGFTPREILDSRNRNIKAYHADTVQEHAKDFAKIAAIAATYGIAAGAAGAAGAGSSASGAGAAGGASALQPITVTAAKLPVASAPGVITGSALPASAGVATMPAASTIASVGGAVTKAATAGKSATEAAGIAAKAKEVAPKVVQGVNQARTIDAIVAGEMPPPPIALEGDSFREWSASLAEQYLESRLRKSGEEMTEAERELAEEQIRREIERMQREAAGQLPGGSRRYTNPPAEVEGAQAAGITAQQQQIFRWGLTAAALGIVAYAATQ